MPITYDSIATTTLSSAQSSVSFTSISASYTDLVLVSDWTLNTGQNILLTFNSDSSNNYSETGLGGNGTAAVSERQSNATSIRVGFYNTNRTIHRVNIMNYSNTTTNKTVLLRWDSDEYVYGRIGLWRNSAAISTITLTTGGGTIQAGSTFTLYGITAA
jgi:hypothetical protein